MKTRPSILRAESVRKHFSLAEGELEILQGVNLEIKTPETVAIMGRSGCGKSTLISVLAGLEMQTSGEIEILGQNLNSFSIRELNSFRARHIGIVFQQFHLLDHLTAFENVRLPLDLGDVQDADARAAEMLEKVGLGHRLAHFPDQLSRGECQRVAIARVLVMKPELLLADEPTGSLDVRTGREVIDLIFQLVESEKIALVMATHDLEVASRCTRRYYMDSGCLTIDRPADYG
jgi:putative ABC transport system ATP-binding protein